MKILELSSSLPQNEYTTEELIESFPCRLSENIIGNILNLGVSKRSLITSVPTRRTSECAMSETDLLDLCVDACTNALAKAGVPIRDIDYFVAAYDVNPFLSPGLSQLLVRKIGFDPYVKHVNVQGIASTAFPKALQLAEDHVVSHRKSRVLVCISGVSSYWFHNQVRGIKNVHDMHQIKQISGKAKREAELRKWIATMEYFLFGDGVAAAVVGGDGDGLEVKKSVEVTNVRKEDYLAGYSRLTSLPKSFVFGFHSHLGREIPRLGVEYTDLALNRLLGRNRARVIRETKSWAVHTGSEKILDTLAEYHKVNPKKLKESHEILKEHGNLAGASLPFILERIVQDHKISKRDLVLMLGYGWGFSAAASLLEA